MKKKISAFVKEFRNQGPGKQWSDRDFPVNLSQFFFQLEDLKHSQDIPD